MYINRNKAIGVIEVLLVFALIGVLLESMYIFSRIVIKIEKRYEKIVKDEELKERVESIEEEIDRSYFFCILEKRSLDFILNIKEKKSQGEILILEIYDYKSYPKKIFKTKIYISKNKKLKVYDGVKRGNLIYLKVESEKEILSKVELIFKEGITGVDIIEKK